MEELLIQISATDPLEWVASFTAIVYVYLAGRDNNWCWVFAAVSAIIWAYVSLVSYQLVSDALLQVFYLIMAGVGLYRWRAASKSPVADDILDVIALEDESDQSKPPILRMSLREHLMVIGGGLLAGLFLGAVVSTTMAATQTYLDAITTAFSIIATFLLIGRRLENWLYWIVIDSVYVYIYVRSGALVFALLMVVYVIMAAYGYFHWRLAVNRGDQVAA